MFKTFKKKFVVLFMLLVTVTIILIGVVSDYIIQNYITTTVVKTFSDDLKDELIKVESFLTGVKTDLDILSENTAQQLARAIESGNKQDIEKWNSKLENNFIKYMDVKRIYSRISFIDLSGNQIVSTVMEEQTPVASTSGLEESEQLAIIEAMKLNMGMFYLSPFSLKRINGKTKNPPEPILHFARPVFDGPNDKTGIVILTVAGNEFLKVIKHSVSGNLTLVNRDGFFLHHSNENLEFRFDDTNTDAERLHKYYPNHAGKILTEESGYADTGRGWVTTWLYWFYDPGDDLLVYRHFIPNPKDKNNYWVLIKSGSKKELIGTLMTMRGMMLGISSIFFAITFPVILFFGLRLTKSISRLKKAMEGFENGEGMEVLDINADDEFTDLTHSFVTMSESLYCTKMNLNAEFQRLKHLIDFSKLVGEEISEKECYSILINYLSKSFYFDNVVAVSFNNSENLAEVIAAYRGENGQLITSDIPLMDSHVTHDARYCRASRSGHKFLVSDVESDYRCQYQEVNQETGSYGCFPVVTGGAVLGWVHLANDNKNYFTDERCFMIESYINTIAPAINSIRLLNAHRKMSVQDPLTGLYNRRFLDEIMDRQIAIADRYKQSLSVMMIDIDHFKKFNDTHGHAFGDKALVTVANIIATSVRDSDTVARYGGEEFIIVLPNTDIQFAVPVAEKIRKAVEECSVANDNGIAEGVTISVGVSSYPLLAQTQKDLVNSADSALYQSKAKGRNMVTRAESDSKTVEKSD